MEPNLLIEPPPNRPADGAAASIPARFARVAALHPRRVAVLDARAEWTYAELEQRSNALAIRLLEGDESSTPVVLLMEHGAPLVAAILAALKAGRMYLALDPGHPRERLTAMWAESGARLLWTDRANAALAGSLASVSGAVRVADPAEPVGARSTGAPLPPVAPDAAAWLMFTSGSAGRPRGVWQNHRGVIHHADVYGELIGLTPEDRVSLLTSCSLAASTSSLFGALLNGATLCPFHLQSQGVERLADWLRERRVTVYHSVPTVFRHLARAGADRRALENLRLVRLGGEPVLRGDVDLFRQLCADDCRLMHALSSTETGLISAFLVGKQTALPEGRVPVGRPVRDVEVFFTDAAGRRAEGANEGRIAVRSAHLAGGYWRQPEATAEKFLTDPGAPGTRSFVTDDLGRLRPDGALELLGRADRVVKIRGLRTDLGEVEAALCATELFEEAAVVSTEEPSGERRLVAYVVPRATAEVSAPARRRALQSLPEHMIPGQFVSLDRLPLTPGGKVDRRALAQQSPPTKESVSQPLPPRGPVEKNLAAIWESVLGVSTVGRQDDFFDLGGTSLQSARILSRIEDQFNLALPASVLVEHGTVEALAALVARGAVKPPAGPLRVLQEASGGRPLFLVHSGEGDVSIYAQLVRRLPGRPIYGFQPVGFDGTGLPLTSIPAMARRYLRDVIARDPAGPYCLAGARIGALITFEMARQLARQGRAVGLVALFDFAPGPERSRVGRQLKRLTDGVRDLLRILRWTLFQTMNRKRTAEWLSECRRRVAHMNCGTRRNYWPSSYPGTINLFLTADARILQEHPAHIESQFAREVRIVRVDGERSRMLVRPAVEEVAGELRAALARIDRQAAPPVPETVFRALSP